MTDPVTTATTYAGAFLVAVAGSLLGHQLGPVAVMAGAGLAGALMSVGEVETQTKLHAVWYVVRFSFAAVFVSGGLSVIAQKFFSVSSVELLALVAFGFGLVGERWKSLLGSAITWFQNTFGRTPGEPRP
jgi:hypothetical protein